MARHLRTSADINRHSATEPDHGPAWSAWGRVCDGAVVTITTTAAAGLVGFRAEPSLDLHGLGPEVRQQVRQRLLSPDFDAWSATAARVGFCAHPVRLQGSSTRVDAATGEVASSYSSADEPLG